MVTMKGDGQREQIFGEVGDANAANVGSRIAPHIIRMAATRAKGRALRDALALGIALAEEMGGDEEGHNGHHTAPEPRPAVHRAKHDPIDHAARKAAQEAPSLCEVCGVEVPGPVATAARKRWGVVLCIPHGREKQVADKEAPAQLQGA
jgi:hypothetical protein